MAAGRTTVATCRPRRTRPRHRSLPHRPDLSTGRLLLLDGHSLAYRAFYALPGGELLHHDGAADQRGLRLHVDADQRAARRGADPRRRRFRRLAQDVPLRDVRRVQGQPVQDARTSSRARSALVKEVLAALRIPSARGRGLRGRRRHRDAGHAAPRREGFDVLICTGDRDALPAGQRPRHRALPAQGRLRADPDDPGGGPGEVRPDAGAVPRLRGAARRPERQPARHPRRGGEDRAKWIVEFGVARRAGRRASTRSRARPATRCAPTSRR